MTVCRLLCLFGCLAAAPALGQMSSDEVVDRIAAHFESASSRLRPEDAGALEQFVSRAKAMPGAHLELLVPITTEPARSRFVAARVSELERRVQALADTAQYRRVAANSNTDALWLALVLPAAMVEGVSRSTSAVTPRPIDLGPTPTPALTAPAVPPPAVSPADLRLADWAVRGIKRPPQGPISAYVARMVPGAVPHEVFERQADQELGMIKQIGLSAEGGWVVKTEIGWIGQGSPVAAP